MNYKPRLIAAAALALCALQASAQPLTPAELGRALYFGAQAFAAAPTVNGVALPVQSAACVSCHGALGAGTREGSQAAPEITRRLHHDASQAWLSAALQGRGRDGRALNAWMPRYALTADEKSALMAYAPLLGQPQDVVRGVSDNQILFGIYVGDAQNISANISILSGVRQVFDSVNTRGGVHGRRLLVQQLHQAHEADQVFALISGVQHSPDLEAASLKQRRLPHLASLTLTPHEATRTDWVVPLLPSLQTQSALLLRALSEQAQKTACLPLILDELSLTTDAQRQALALHTLASLQRLAREQLAGHSVCVGVLAPSTRAAEQLLAPLQGLPVTLDSSISLAVLSGTALSAQHRLVLPAPAAIAAHAQRQAQSVWHSLGQVAAHAVVEALSRSGRLLQPELVLTQLRELSGHSALPELAEPRLAWGRSNAHGLLPEVVNTSPYVSTTPLVVSKGD